MKNPLLITLPCHAGDVDNAETLLHWIAELGQVEEHSLLIAADNGLPVERVKAMGDIARPVFNDVTLVSVPTGAKGWPLAANLAFRAVCRTIQETFKLPFLWLEADAVPLTASWLDAIAEAYWRCPKPFMGALLDNDVNLEVLPKRYMAGCAVYPQDAYGILNGLWNDTKFTGPTGPKRVPNVQNWERGIGAFDMSGAAIVVPRAKNTPLISHFWGTTYSGSGVPLYRAGRTEADPPNVVTLDQIPKEAVLRHRVKDVPGFVTMWRMRVEQQKALVVEALKPTGASQYVLEKALEAGLIEAPKEIPTPPATPPARTMPELAKPAEANPNFRGGNAAAKERRDAAAQRSREYLEAARAKRQQEQQAAMQARAGTTESAVV